MKNPNLRRSINQEDDVTHAFASIYGSAQRQPGSGNQPGKSGDVRAGDEAIIECKETAAASITLKYVWLKTIMRVAMQGGLRRYLALRFSAHSYENFYVVDEHTFYQLLRAEVELQALTDTLRNNSL